MDFEEYQTELRKLYDEFVKLHQEAGGAMPKRLPATPRPYELNCIIDVTQSPDEIDRELKKFRNQILETRKNIMSYYTGPCSKDVVVDLPRRSDGKLSRNPPEEIIEKARKALIAHQNKDQHKLEIAKQIGIIKDTHLSDKEAKDAEHRVSRYLSHAQTLITAITEDSFFKAIETPFNRSK